MVIPCYSMCRNEIADKRGSYTLVGVIICYQSVVSTIQTSSVVSVFKSRV